MLVLSVFIETLPEHTESFRQAVLRHARNTLNNEKGCLHFTVHEHASTPGRFFLYEAYATRKDLEEVHKKAPYLKEFQDLTAPWIHNKQAELWEAFV